MARPIETKVRLTSIQKFSSSLTENKLCHQSKDQTVHVEKGNTVFIVTIVRNISTVFVQNRELYFNVTVAGTDICCLALNSLAFLWVLDETDQQQ